MNKTAKQLAKQGRNGDTRLAHLTPGEVVVPKSVQPAVLGLLADAFAQNGHSLDRYTVGKDASKNPRTGLLEFYDGGDGDGGDNGNDSGDDNGRGAGKAGASGDDGSDGESGWGGRDRGGGGGDAIGRAMMDQNAAPLGYGRFTGETTPGTLSRMRDNMREGGYSGTGISDAMSGMGVGYGTRAGLLGYGTALGSLGTKALNSLGGLVGSMALGPAGSILGGTLGSAVTADNLGQWGNQFAGNVVGSLAGQLGALAGPQLGPVASMGAKALASRALNGAMANAGPAQRNAKDPGSSSNDQRGIAGLMDSPLGRTAAVASDYSYTPGPVAAVNWSPTQWGTQYDPVRGLLG